SSSAASRSRERRRSLSGQRCSTSPITKTWWAETLSTATRRTACRSRRSAKSWEASRTSIRGVSSSSARGCVSSAMIAAADLLAVAGLGKSYGRRRVLDGVSFSVRPGEVLGLVGPNGAGKTTLFGCLAGILPADSGRVADGAGRTLPPPGRRDLLFYLPDGILPWPEQRLDRLLVHWG